MTFRGHHTGMSHPQTPEKAYGRDARLQSSFIAEFIKEFYTQDIMNYMGDKENYSTFQLRKETYRHSNAEMSRFRNVNRLYC